MATTAMLSPALPKAMTLDRDVLMGAPAFACHVINQGALVIIVDRQGTILDQAPAAQVDLVLTCVDHNTKTYATFISLEGNRSFICDCPLVDDSIHLPDTFILPHAGVHAVQGIRDWAWDVEIGAGGAADVWMAAHFDHDVPHLPTRIPLRDPRPAAGEGVPHAYVYYPASMFRRKLCRSSRGAMHEIDIVAAEHNEHGEVTSSVDLRMSSALTASRGSDACEPRPATLTLATSVDMISILLLHPLTASSVVAPPIVTFPHLGQRPIQFHLNNMSAEIAGRADVHNGPQRVTLAGTEAHSLHLVDAGRALVVLGLDGRVAAHDGSEHVDILLTVLDSLTDTYVTFVSLRGRSSFVILKAVLDVHRVQDPLKAFRLRADVGYVLPEEMFRVEWGMWTRENLVYPPCPPVGEAHNPCGEVVFVAHTRPAEICAQCSGGAQRDSAHLPDPVSLTFYPGHPFSAAVRKWINARCSADVDEEREMFTVLHLPSQHYTF